MSQAFKGRSIRIAPLRITGVHSDQRDGSGHSEKVTPALPHQ
jgi:hypothetical protein